MRNEAHEVLSKKLQQANKDLDFHIEERDNRAAELIIANKELLFQNEEKEKRAAELVIANKELLFQNQQKEDRAAELIIANKELIFQNEEKEKRAAELVIANKELLFQSQEKEDRAAELIIANKELIFQSEEKEKRAAELVIANKELLFQNQEKEDRAAELVIANDELVFQNKEREKRAAELVITNKKLAFSYKKTEKSEERFRNVIEQSINPVLILKGKDFVLELANEPLFKIWKVGKEAIGKPFLEILPEMKGQPFEGLLLDVLQNGVTHYGNEQPAHFIRENGEAQTVYFNFVYLPYRESDHSISGIMVQAYDVTDQVFARKKIEESALEFQQLADSIIQMVWVTNAKGMHEYYNKRWYDFTGSDFDTSKGEGWNQMLHVDDQTRALEKWKISLKTGEPYEIEYRLKNKFGEYIWVLARAAPFYDAKGKVIKWFGTCTDINEQKLLMQQKDDFMSIASHELKTPITTLTASLQLLNRMKDNPSANMFPTLIERASKSVDKVNLLIKDLLHVTQFNNGQLHLNKSRIILSKLIDDCCHQFRSEGIYCIVIDGNLDLEIYADTSRIEQVIINLVCNAIKYAPASKEILITIENDKEMARVSVTDEGQGISADKIPHLFDRYFRVDSGGSQYSGLGLGLYICGEIIRKHQGQIGADSKVGKGSTFWFTLPVN